MRPGNSLKQRKRPPTRSSWQKGQSGNPSGRPKDPPELKQIRDLCRHHATEAVQRLVKLMRSTHEPVAVRASALLDRGYGRVGPQPEEAEPYEPPTVIFVRGGGPRCEPIMVNPPTERVTFGRRGSHDSNEGGR